MLAAVYRKYGPPEVVQVEEIPTPKPKSDEILIRNHATTVTSGDGRMRRPDPFLVRLMNGFFTPRHPILGFDIAGEIVETGADVTEFKVGDKIFGSTGLDGGAHAQYLCQISSGSLALMPEGLSYEEAASLCFGAHTSLHYLKEQGEVTEGQKILIWGASGSLGVYAVQLAKYFGAKVTAVCGTDNVERVRALGADEVIDYKKQDFPENQKFDAIYDTVGKSPFFACVRALNAKGKYLRAVHFTPGSLLKGMIVNLFTTKKVIGGVAKDSAETVNFLKQLVEEQKLKPVIGEVFPLREIAKAHASVDSGHKYANVVVSMEHDPDAS